jgi:lipoprotein NlpI
MCSSVGRTCGSRGRVGVIGWLRDSWGLRRSLAGFLGLAVTVGCVVECSGQLPPGWSLEIDSALERGDAARALQLADAAVEQASESSQVHLVRGMVRFRLGRIDSSLTDFDRSIALDPRSAPHNWQRGIALYYAGRYADGAAQFEQHREVNPNDVENSAWHFLCVAQLRGLERARAELIPSGGDGRPPMMKVLELFAGRATVQDVLDEAERAGGGTRGQALARFYAYLYIGLYLSVQPQVPAAESLQWLQRAVDTQAGGYMRDVARVHLQLAAAGQLGGP